MYPKFLQTLIYKGSIHGPADQTVRSYLSGEQPGAFAFFQIVKAATETSGLPGAKPTPLTMERALGLTGGNREFARLMMVQPDESLVGLMFVTPERQIKSMRLNCEQVNLRFTSLEQLLADMRSNGILVDPAKMHFPGMAYMEMDFGDEAL